MGPPRAPGGSCDDAEHIFVITEAYVTTSISKIWQKKILGFGHTDRWTDRRDGRNSDVDVANFWIYGVFLFYKQLCKSILSKMASVKKKLVTTSKGQLFMTRNFVFG